MKTMSKAMYGKSMMKKSGFKKMQPGGPVTPVPGMKKSQAKAEEFYDKNPSVRTYTNEYTGKKIPTGPMTKKEYQNAAERAADVYNDKPTPMLKKGGTTKMKMGGAKKPKMMSGGAKPKAMYGASMKPDMKKGGSVKKMQDGGFPITAKAAARKVGKGKGMMTYKYGTTDAPGTGNNKGAYVKFAKDQESNPYGGKSLKGSRSRRVMQKGGVKK